MTKSFYIEKEQAEYLKQMAKLLKTSESTLVRIAIEQMQQSWRLEKEVKNNA